MFICSERYTLSWVSVCIPSSWQKKCVTTKEKMDGPIPIKVDQALHPVTLVLVVIIDDDDGGRGDDDDARSV